MKINPKLVILTTALLIPGLASAAAVERSISKSQVVRMFSGNTIKTEPYITVGNKIYADSMRIYMDPNGTLVGVMKRRIRGMKRKDIGRWWVKRNGQMCARWQHWNNTPSCTYWFNFGNSVIAANARSRAFETMIFKGNIRRGNHV